MARYRHDRRARGTSQGTLVSISSIVGLSRAIGFRNGHVTPRGRYQLSLRRAGDGIEALIDGIAPLRWSDPILPASEAGDGPEDVKVRPDHSISLQDEPRPGGLESRHPFEVTGL